jgi:uncharacterized membrane protein
MKAFAAIATAVLVVLYPVAIWIGLTYFSARTVGLWIVALLVPGLWLRLRSAPGAADPAQRRADLWAVLRVPLVVLLVVSLGVAFDDRRFVLAMPVLINAVLLLTFAASLFGEHTLIERFARMQEKDGLSAAQIAHCRQVTWAWCGFFLLNGAACAALALLAPLAWWAAYTGGLAYALMGVMFSAEYVLRQYRFRRYGRGLHDRLLSRILPPRDEEGGALPAAER